MANWTILVGDYNLGENRFESVSQRIREFSTQVDSIWAFNNPAIDPGVQSSSLIHFQMRVDDGGTYYDVLSDPNLVYLGMNFSVGIRTYTYNDDGDLTLADENVGTGGGSQGGLSKEGLRDQTDNTFWDGGFGMDWSGSQWYFFVGPTELNAIGNWAENFRPQSVKVDYTMTGNFDLILYESRGVDDSIIAQMPNYESGTELKLGTIFNYNADDDFTGTNGDLPDMHKWWMQRDDNDLLRIQNNTLYYNSPGGAVNLLSALQSRFQLVGDFDIQINFAVNFSTAPSTSNSYMPQLNVRRVTDNTALARVSRLHDPTQNGYRSEGVGAAANEYSDPFASSGQLRLVRSGGTITCYVYEAFPIPQWGWNGNPAGRQLATGETDNVDVQIIFEQELNGQVNAYADDFVVNSADDVILPFEHDITKIEFAGGQPDIFVSDISFRPSLLTTCALTTIKSWQVDGYGNITFLNYFRPYQFTGNMNATYIPTDQDPADPWKLVYVIDQKKNILSFRVHENDGRIQWLGESDGHQNVNIEGGQWLDGDEYQGALFTCGQDQYGVRSYETLITPAGTYPKSNPDDGFNKFNGERPDIDLWRIYDEAERMSIQSNRLTWANTINGTGMGSDVRSQFYMDGDFDVKTDVTITTGPNTDGWVIGLLCQSWVWDGSKNETWEIALGYQAGARAVRVKSNKDSLSFWPPFAEFNTGTSSVTVRITRVGDQLTFYYNIGGAGYVQLYTTSRPAWGQYTQLFLRQSTFNANPAAGGYQDNFQVLSGDILWPPCALNDRFDASDGTPPNPNIWTIGTGGETPDITNVILNDGTESTGKLRQLSYNGDLGPSRVDSVYKLDRSFDVVVYYDGTPSSTEGWVFGLEAYIDNDNRFEMRWQWRNASPWHQWTARSYIGGSQVQNTNTADVKTAAALRIQRTGGNEIRMYGLDSDGGGTWRQLQSRSGFPGGPVTIRLKAGSWASTPVVPINWNDFHVRWSHNPTIGFQFVDEGAGSRLGFMSPVDVIDTAVSPGFNKIHTDTSFGSGRVFGAGYTDGVKSYEAFGGNLVARSTETPWGNARGLWFDKLNDWLFVASRTSGGDGLTRYAVDANGNLTKETNREPDDGASLVRDCWGVERNDDDFKSHIFVTAESDGLLSYRARNGTEPPFSFTPGWNQVLDDTFWDWNPPGGWTPPALVGGGWNGSSWDSGLWSGVWQGIMLGVRLDGDKAGWEQGFRPPFLIVSHTASPSADFLMFYDNDAITGFAPTYNLSCPDAAKVIACQLPYSTGGFLFASFGGAGTNDDFARFFIYRQNTTPFQVTDIQMFL